MLYCRCVQGLDALDAGTPVVEAVSQSVKELEVIGIDAKYISAFYYLLPAQLSYRECHSSVQVVCTSRGMHFS